MAEEGNRTGSILARRSGDDDLQVADRYSFPFERGPEAGEVGGDLIPRLLGSHLDGSLQDPAAKQELDRYFAQGHAETGAGFGPETDGGVDDPLDGGRGTPGD